MTRGTKRRVAAPRARVRSGIPIKLQMSEETYQALKAEAKQRRSTIERVILRRVRELARG